MATSKEIGMDDVTRRRFVARAKSIQRLTLARQHPDANRQALTEALIDDATELASTILRLYGEEDKTR